MPITDRESAQAWLKGQPHQVQVAFATRCALRALPAIMSDKDAALRGLALPVLRAILTSRVAGTCPTPEVMLAVDAASTATYAAASVDAAMSGGEGESVDVFLRPLWPGGALPEGLARQYEKLRSF
ncbi:hypothetical protein [Rhodovulum sulfidophilum]|uniref:hypothetical protein n=1 Tax=Rhodovulum sulfidophilum TaxID=35806 RepID=UPI0019212A91|nr:hypothetical protein [Rhodovulum sulfidophilum]MBL3559687.1 hypothetical protein [Rhodovulum sulfidophilum]